MLRAPKERRIWITIRCAFLTISFFSVQVESVISQSLLYYNSNVLFLNLLSDECSVVIRRQKKINDHLLHTLVRQINPYLQLLFTCQQIQSAFLIERLHSSHLPIDLQSLKLSRTLFFHLNQWSRSTLLMLVPNINGLVVEKPNS